MDRAAMLRRLRNTSEAWDLVIVGGGATGLGAAIEAASRGYRAVLLEQRDFSSGTSSRSTKLVHGGVRYLQQGNVSLVLEALKERGFLRRNAPHLVHDLPFVVPNYDWWEAPFYGIGLRLYDALAGKHGFGRSKNLSKEETLQRLPTLETKGLRGGVVYFDGQFDDARLAIHLAMTAAELGGTLLNYMQVTRLIKEQGIVRGVAAMDLENGEEHELEAKVVVNATGAFCDAIRRMDDSQATGLISPSQGVHIVLKRSFLPGDSAIMVPHTDDGRVLFAIPWHDRVVVGTTETRVDEPSLEPQPLPAEVDFLLSHVARYLSKDPSPGDILSTFAGIRPLVGAGDERSTSAISRDHTVHISRSGLLTIAGGKWTTYRKMAEDTIDHAAALADLREMPSVTRELRVHGYHQNAAHYGDLEIYGSDAPDVRDVLNRKSNYARRLHPSLRPRAGEVIWAVTHEMARTVEDFLARRARCLILDAKASMEAAPRVAELMAEALGRDEKWKSEQVRSYLELAKRYLPLSQT